MPWKRRAPPATPAAVDSAPCRKPPPARGGLLNWRWSISGRRRRLGRKWRRRLCGARGRLGRRLSHPEKIGYAGEETPARLLAGASWLGQLLLEAGDAALGRSECLLHDQCALNEEVGRCGLLRNFSANVIVGFGILRWAPACFKRSKRVEMRVRSSEVMGRKEAHLRLFASFGWRRRESALEQHTPRWRLRYSCVLPTSLRGPRAVRWLFVWAHPHYKRPGSLQAAQAIQPLRTAASGVGELMLSKSAHVGFAKAATLKRVRAVLSLAEMIFGTWTRRSRSKGASPCESVYACAERHESSSSSRTSILPLIGNAVESRSKRA